MSDHDASRSDHLEQRRWRFLCWDLPGLVGAVSLAGRPGLGLLSGTWTAAMWVVSLGVPGTAHWFNWRRCGRRRSAWSGPCLLVLAVVTAAAIGLRWTTDSIGWVWVVAFAVWCASHVHDRRPHRRYAVRSSVASSLS